MASKRAGGRSGPGRDGAGRDGAPPAGRTAATKVAGKAKAAGRPQRAVGDATASKAAGKPAIGKGATRKPATGKSVTGKSVTGKTSARGGLAGKGPVGGSGGATRRAGAGGPAPRSGASTSPRSGVRVGVGAKVSAPARTAPARSPVSPSSRARAGASGPGKSGRPTTAVRLPTRSVPLILIVEDYQDAREMYAEFLAYSGFTVAQAENGREAVEKASELLPDIILMDLSMPGMDGWEATRRLKGSARTRNIPVVALTGHALAGHSEGARKAGCDSFLAKPCLPDALLAEVKRMLELKKITKVAAHDA